MDIKIRALRPSDAERNEQIHADGWEYAYRGILPDEYLDAQKIKFTSSERIELTRAWLGEPDGIKLGAVDNNDVVMGMVTGGKRINTNGETEFFLSGLYLAPKHIGHGLGKLLMTEFAKQVIAAGGDKFTLGCLEHNKSRGFYEKMGGRVVGSEPFQNTKEIIFEFSARSLTK